MITPTQYKVLLAEDEFLISKEIQRLLESFDYEVIGIAPDGIKACEMAAEMQPDVILMDIKMPKLDGLGAAERIMNENPTPIVIMTAHENLELIDKASINGVGAYLTKPPDAAEINRAITIAIARHKDLMKLKELYDQVNTQKEELEKAMAEIKTLAGMLPICSYCKKIRNDDGYWEQVDQYIKQHTNVDFSHGYCPECVKKYFPDLYDTEQFKTH